MTKVSQYGLMQSNSHRNWSATEKQKILLITAQKAMSVCLCVNKRHENRVDTNVSLCSCTSCTAWLVTLVGCRSSHAGCRGKRETSSRIRRHALYGKRYHRRAAPCCAVQPLPPQLPGSSGTAHNALARLPSLVSVHAAAARRLLGASLSSHHRCCTGNITYYRSLAAVWG